MKSLVPEKWTDMMPPPFDEDPVVVLVLIPDDAIFKLASTVDGEMTFGFAELKDGAVLGLQVRNPPIGDYLEHVMAFRERGKRMATPEYLGPLSDVPNALLMQDGLRPLVFSHQEPHHLPLDLRNYFTPDGESECN